MNKFKSNLDKSQFNFYTNNKYEEIPRLPHKIAILMYVLGLFKIIKAGRRETYKTKKESLIFIL